MKQLHVLSTILLLFCCCLSLAQQPVATDTTPVVPPLVNFAGVLTDSNGKPISADTPVTFLLYKEPRGGSPVWMESQNVKPDSTGHYSVMLGATSSQGLPLDIFVAGQAHWLAVQVQDQEEQPRVLLVSAPYALKAGDAETIGGLPPSAFVLAGPPASSAATGSTSTVAAASTSTAPPPTVSNVTTTGGTVNGIPLFTTATNIQNSILTQTGTTAVNISGKLNLPSGGTATTTAGFNSRPETMVASAYNSTSKAAVAQTFQLQAEPAGNNTASPSGTLNLLYGSGTTVPAETGLKINNKGLITFATGQTFPGTGSGTVKSVATGAGLTGGPITSTGTLSIANAGVTNTMLANPSLTVKAGTDLTGGGAVTLGGSTTLNLDTTKVPTLAAASNTFTGTINASSFVGSGAGLTNVNAAELGGVAPATYARLDLGEVFMSYVASEQSLIADWFATNSGGITPGLEFQTGEAITSTQITGTNQSGLDFWTNYSDQMSITSSGNVGIGTRQPYTKLHVRQDNSGGLGPSLTLMNGGGGAGSGASIDFDGYDTTVNSPTVRIQSIDDGNSSSNLTFQTKVPGAATNGLVEQVRLSDYGSLIVDASSNNTGSIGAGAAAGTGLVFGGSGSGEGIASSRSAVYNQFGLDFYTGWTSRVSIANNGYVTAGYGMTVVNGSGTALLVGGDASVTGCLVVAGSTVAGNCSSDSALKTNVRPFPSVLNKLAQLQPVHFNWKNTNPSGYPSDPTRQTGLIAQQVEKVFPEMVSMDKGGYRRVNYGQLPYLLLQGVRELKADNDKLHAEAQAEREKNERAWIEVARLRRIIATTDERMATMDRLAAGKDAQIAGLSRQVEQLRKTQEQMAVLLARFAPSQGGDAKLSAAVQLKQTLRESPTVETVRNGK